MKVAAVIFSMLPLLSSAWDDIVLPPSPDKQGTPYALLFTQGANIKTDQYTKILSKIQDAVSFPLWVGTPQMIEDIASIPTSVSGGMKRIKSQLSDSGMPEDVEVFYGGHSLGGAMLPGYVADLKDDEDDAKGMFLLGSFLTRQYKTEQTAKGRPQVAFRIPTLTVGAELDGLCRLSRIAEALYTQITFSENPSAATDYMPVTAIPGMNHMQFASGKPSSFVLDNDIQSDVTEDEAHELVVKDVVAFINSIVDGKSSRFLRSRVQESTKFVQPIVDALLIEGYEQFLPPCYCEDKDEYGGLQYGTCSSTPTCNGGVRWTGEFSQPIMAGVGVSSEIRGLTMTAVDTIHLVTEEKPSCHLPHIHGHPNDNENPGNGNSDPICDKPQGCHLELTTVTQHSYENSGEVDIWRAHFSIPWVDTGYLPITANELKTKIKSRQAVWEAAGIANVTYSESDEIISNGGSADRCGEINQAAIDWATAQLPAATRKRFDKYGQKFVVGPDLSTCKAGPCWIWDPLRFDKDDKANTVNIQAVSFATENKNNYPCGENELLPCSAGFHYCKLLSPARALEWMYTDGLRNLRGLNKE